MEESQSFCTKSENMALRPLLTVTLIVLAWTASPNHSNAQSVVADDAQLELVAEGFKFTEGPAVDKDGNIFFTDQPNDRIMRYSIDGELETWLKPCGRSNGLFFERTGNMIACADEKNELWRILPDKTHEVLLAEFEGKKFNGPNDVWVSADGSYFFTDPFYKRKYWKRESDGPELPKRVYRFLPDSKEVQIAAEDFKQPNGIVGDVGRSVLYVADIGDRKTYRFNVDTSGKLTSRKLFCEFGSDGMTLDQDGNVYLTGKGVMVFNSEGKLRERIAVPEGWTANVCFGGKRRDVLFITASDSLYAIKMKTRGLD
ncbi:MAG: SMP-30/gluconolactonase/LRE family protein [Planctomycetota bacterium]